MNHNDQSSDDDEMQPLLTTNRRVTRSCSQNANCDLSQVSFSQ